MSLDKNDNLTITSLKTPDLCSLSARRLAGLIASGELCSVDVVDSHISRIQDVNPTINAIVAPRYEAAREEAREADKRRESGEQLGPLHGVPITIKESIDFAGLPSTFGVIAHRNDVPSVDNPYVARLRNAGAIVLGKTNVSQMLIFAETDNPLYGLTKNPWDISRSPGGSSGGEAAIIAAFGSPLGLGSDIGGSCRIPAAATGIVGFKPTMGRLPDNGRGSVPIGQLAIRSEIGFLARHVEDIALGLEIASKGNEPPEESHPLGNPTGVDVAKLTVGYFFDDGTFTAVAAARRAVLEAKDILERRGVRLVPWTPPSPAEALGLFYRILGGDRARGFRRFLNGSTADRRLRELMLLGMVPAAALPLVRLLLRLTGKGKLSHILRSFGHYDTASHWDTVEAIERYRERFLAELDSGSQGSIDVILSPATPLPALRHGATVHISAMGAYNVLYNVLGYPAGVVPVTRVRADEETATPRGRDKMDRIAYETEKNSAGLPIAVQIAARPWRDHIALAVLGAIETGAKEREDYPILR